MLDTLIDAWIANPDGSAKQALLDYMDTPEYRALPYKERNKRFITSSKLKLFEACELFAKYKYEDEIITGFEASPALLIGGALDTLVTYGQEEYDEKYLVLARKTKDDEVYTTDEGYEMVVNDEVERYRLTASEQETIDRMRIECTKHPLFPREWQKRNIVWLAFGKYPCKAELDHFTTDRGIVDLKTCADITSFRAMSYLLQMGFYYGGCLEEDLQKYTAELCVVDKNKWSRSHVWKFGVETLDGVQGTINKMLLAYAEAQATGLWRGPDPDSQEGLELLWKSEFWDHCPLSRTSPPTEL